MNLDSDLNTFILAHQQQRRLGIVVGGSLSRGLAVKLESHVALESLAVGRYVVVHGQTDRFFCMVNDISLESTNPLIQSNPPDMQIPFYRDVYSGTVAYSLISVIPMLVITPAGPMPVKTIPTHFTEVLNATEEDVNAVFGVEDHHHFNVGSPLELLETNININLVRLVERSIGVFGKSGTGKSFLTRVLLAGVLSRKTGVSLIFDMHNDYGWAVTDEKGNTVKGLKQLFNADVVILTLDADSSRRRGAPYDAEIRLGYNEITPEDIAMLRATMDLSDTMIDAVYTLYRRWSESWIERLLNPDEYELEEVVETTNINMGTLNAIQRRLSRFERWSFLVPHNTGDSINRIIHTLVKEEKSVVLEFGRYGNNLEAYMLVANYITRRIHTDYIEKMEAALGDKSKQPPQLLITIEEAHKFLEPGVARQTTFGIIAREMRKYNVTLLIVDQRPSAIDDEVMSQVGTRVTALLDNERDINAVLNGVSGAAGLREVLSRLETKQQAIIMGHAVPMPVVIKPRNYDETFYQALISGELNAEEIKLALGKSAKKRL